MILLDESRRRAYLGAMGITVWVPRTAEVREPAAQLDVEVSARPALDARLAREQLPKAMATPAVQPSGNVAPRPLAVSREQTETALSFAIAGPLLFLDEAVPPALQAAATALLGAIAFALTGKLHRAELQAFDWPPQGVAVDAGQTRDAVMGRLRKFIEQRGFQRLILMGEIPASLLLRWNAELFAARRNEPLTIEGLDIPVSVTLSGTHLLREPQLKRVAWRDLRRAVPCG